MTIACPGPIATGTEGTPRNMFGAEALTAKHEERGGARKRLVPPRVAELIARAAYNRADVTWIARHPVLLLGAFLLESVAGSSPCILKHQGLYTHYTALSSVLTLPASPWMVISGLIERPPPLSWRQLQHAVLFDSSEVGRVGAVVISSCCMVQTQCNGWSC